MVRRGRRASWSATMVPTMARTLATTSAQEAARLRELAARARAIGRADLAAQLDDGAANAALGAALAQQAAYYWVAEPMARLAMDASQDVPAITPASAPTTSALMVLAGPLPAWDTTGIGGLALRQGQRTDIQHDEPVPIDAITWHITQADTAHAQLRIELMCRPHRLPLPLLEHQAPFLVPFAHWRLTIPTTLEASRTVITTREGMYTGARAGADIAVLSWLQAAWSLMTSPNLATTTPAAPARPTTPGRAPAGRTPDQVQVIDLKPARRALLDAPTADHDTGRRLTTRHVVRGHWKNTPHGPGASLRRLQWIDDYIRGPQGAPLTTRDHVWAWRHQ
ncbi:MAG: hypothetical protein Q4D96_10150 [Propionibacteriaceae bacterium]|nr:hypothetical protein [Propionibacteriaceae bacterium]